MERVRKPTVTKNLSEKKERLVKNLQEIFSLAKDYGKWVDYLLVRDEDGRVISLSPDEQARTISHLEDIRHSLDIIQKNTQEVQICLRDCGMID